MQRPTESCHKLGKWELGRVERRLKDRDTVRAAVMLHNDGSIGNCLYENGSDLRVIVKIRLECELVWTQGLGDWGEIEWGTLRDGL